jgi:hypothetical protein
MIGVDYELFWTLNPKSLIPFVRAFDLKSKYDDRVAWQQGAYIRLAILSSLDKNNKYPSSPFMSSPIASETPEERQERIKDKMFRQMELLNSRFRKEDNNG